MRTADAARGGARLGQALQLRRRRRHGHQRHRPEGPRNAANSCAQEFLDTYAWKTKRTIGKAKKYSEAEIADVTGVAFRQSDEKLRICLLRALDGVDWPVASTLLHVGVTADYPILDYRALWSLGDAELGQLRVLVGVRGLLSRARQEGGRERARPRQGPLGLLRGSSGDRDALARRPRVLAIEAGGAAPSIPAHGRDGRGPALRVRLA